MISADYKNNSQHAYKMIGKDIKSGEIPGIVLLCGKEEYLIKWYSNLLAHKYVSDAVSALDLVILEDESATLENIKENLETVSLMSQRKVVLLPDFLPAAAGRSGGFSGNDMELFMEYFSEIPKESLLIIEAAEDKNLDDRKKPGKTYTKLKTAAEKYGRAYDFQPLAGSTLRGFIEKRFRNAGKRYRPAVVDTVIHASGYCNKAIEYDLFSLSNDLKKIIAYSENDEITDSDVMAVISVNPEDNVFLMLDAIARNRKDEAFKLLHDTLLSGTPAPVIIRLIANELELMLSVKELREEGCSVAEMQKRLKMKPNLQFKIKKAMSAGGRYSKEHLKKMLSSAYDLDEHIKSGLFDKTLAFEYFIAII